MLPSLLPPVVSPVEQTAKHKSDFAARANASHQSLIECLGKWDVRPHSRVFLDRWRHRRSIERRGRGRIILHDLKFSIRKTAT
jgi:hypothetical protein